MVNGVALRLNVDKQAGIPKILLKSPLGSVNPYCADAGRREKINLSFYFHASLWCLKTFYEGLRGLPKTLLGHRKEV